MDNFIVCIHTKNTLQQETDIRAKLSINKEISYLLFVTIHFIPAALAAASPIALSSTTTQLRGKKEYHN